MKKNLSYIDSVHRDGRIWNISVMVLLLAFPLTVAAIFGAAPDWKALVVGLIATAPMYWAVGAIETVTFVPMLGAGAAQTAHNTPPTKHTPHHPCRRMEPTIRKHPYPSLWWTVATRPIPKPTTLLGTSNRHKQRMVATLSTRHHTTLATRGTTTHNRCHSIQRTQKQPNLLHGTTRRMGNTIHLEMATHRTTTTIRTIHRHGPIT